MCVCVQNSMMLLFNKLATMPREFLLYVYIERGKFIYCSQLVSTSNHHHEKSFCKENYFLKVHDRVAIKEATKNGLVS